MGKNQLPKVSIVIPSYNRTNFLFETLYSIQNQVYRNWECIIVDDGSNTLEYQKIESYCTKDKRLRLIKRSIPPKGASTCRNIGINSARGEYIIFFDSDDIMVPWCLNERVRFAENHKKFDYYVFHSLFFHKKPGDSKLTWNPISPNNDHLQRFLFHDNQWQTGAILWRSNIVKKEIRWDKHLKQLQDWDMHVRALSMGFSYLISDDVPDYLIRISNQQMSTNQSTKEKLFSNLLMYIKTIQLLHHLQKETLQNMRGIMGKILMDTIFDNINLNNSVDLYSISTTLRNTEFFTQHRKLLFILYFKTYSHQLVKQNRLLSSFIFKLRHIFLKYTREPRITHKRLFMSELDNNIFNNFITRYELMLL